jgi:hypothetical protein
MRSVVTPGAAAGKAPRLDLRLRVTIVSRAKDLVNSEKGSGRRLEEDWDECPRGREIPGQPPRAGRGQDPIRPSLSAIDPARTGQGRALVGWGG